MCHWGVAPLRAVAGLLPLLALISGCTTTMPIINVESEPTEDGLYAVSGTDADQAWARPDVDMAQYSKIILQGIAIEYRPGGETQRNRFARISGDPYEVTHEQKEQFREIAEEEILDEFSESRRFTLVDAAGTDVLLVTVQLLDLVSYIPPDAPLSEIYLSEVGEATLVLELRDSATEAVLARVVDRHTAERIDRNVEFTVRASNTAEAQRLFHAFARMLRQRLDEFGALGP